MTIANNFIILYNKEKYGYTSEHSLTKIKKIIFLSAVLALILMVAACTTKMVTVGFYADGELRYEYRVEKGGYLEDIPDVPEKEGYKGSWTKANLDKIEEDTRVDAIYVKNTYTVVFRADGTEISKKVLEIGKVVTEVPDVPEKEGYSGEWNISKDALASLTTDTVIEAVYKKLAVAVNFYYNTYNYTLARVTEGEKIPLNTYYEYRGEYVLTSDVTFASEKSYFTRMREYYTTAYAEDGRIDDLPALPEQEGLSVKWMKVESTATGEVFSTPDFTDISSGFSVVAYPYVSVHLVDEQDEATRSSTIDYEIGETVSSINPLISTIADREFYGWYSDRECKTRVVFPVTLSNNVTFYAKWIRTKATEGVSISNGIVVGYSGSATEVYIPPKYVMENGKTDYVTAIGDNAFKNSVVSSISIPATIQSIGKNAFYGCSLLTKVDFPDGNFVSSYGSDVFRGCRNLISFDFSEKTVSIGSYAFYGCEKLSSVTGLEDSTLREVEAYAFSGCGKITALSLPATVTSIGERAFSGLSLADITFVDPSGISRIGSYAFDSCKKFAGFTSPALREIGAEIFAGCTSLRYATVFGAYKVAELFGTAAPAAGEGSGYYSVRLGAKTYYVPESLYSVLILVGSDGTVHTDVLYDCYSVKNVELQGRVEKIASYAFRLVNYPAADEASRRSFYAIPFTIELPGTLIEIESNAFRSRTDLAEIRLPASVKTVGEYAFNGIVSLRTVTAEGKNLSSVGKFAFTDTPWYSGYTGIIGLGKVLLGVSKEYCTKTSYFDITEDVVRSYSVVAPYAFYDNNVLQKINLSETISSIGDYAFADCTGLRTFSFNVYNSTATRVMGERVLAGCTGLADLTVCEDIEVSSLFAEAEGIPSSLHILRVLYSGRNEDLTAEDPSVLKSDVFATQPLLSTQIGTLEIGEGFVRIRENAFKDMTSLKVLFLSSTITSIEERAFDGCNQLTEVQVAGSSLVSIADYAFYGCADLESFTFPSSVVSIGKSAFVGAVFTSFTAPTALKTIGESAFDGCGVLRSVTLNNVVTSIGDYAFRNCNLLSLSLPSTVRFISANAEFVGQGMLDGNNEFISLTLAVGVTVRTLFGSSVPTSFRTAAVTRGAVIADEFRDVTTLTNIELHKGITSIGNNAFNNCSSLQNVVVPYTVSSIGEYAFAGCVSLKNCTFNSDISGSRLTTTGKGIFSGCTVLKKVMFPSSIVTADWDEMFYNCSSLTDVNVPAAVRTIGDNAFYGCEKLSSLDIHDNVTYIGDYAFYNCVLLELDNVDFGYLTHIGNYAFQNCRKLGNVRAEKASFIGEGAYNGCDLLTELTAGEENLSYYADSAVLSGISIVNVAESVENISVNDYLTGCNALSLTSVVVYTTAAQFPALDFARKINDLTSGHSVNFFSVTHFNTVAEYNADDDHLEKIRNIYCKPSQQTYTYEYNEETMTATITGISSQNPEEYVYLSDETVKNGKTYKVTAIGNSAFYNKSMVYVVIPASVERIGNSAFALSTVHTVVFESGSRCSVIDDNAFSKSGIVSLAAPSSLQSIGNAAFDGCSSLTDITFFANSKLSHIGDNAFYNATALARLSFKGPLSYVGSAAFSGSGVQQVDFGEKAALEVLGENLFLNVTHLTSVILPSTVTEIKPSAFSGVSFYNEHGEEEYDYYGYKNGKFIFPSGVTTVGKKAFAETNGLETVVFSSSLVSIGDEAFSQSTSLKEIFIPDSVQTIGNYAFSECDEVTVLTVGKDVLTIGHYAFYGLNKLIAVYFNAERATDFDSANNVFTYAGDGAGGVEVYISGNVRSLPDNMFYSTASTSGLPKVTAVSVEGTPSIERIGDNAFRGLTTLTSFTIPATVLHIGGNAFEGCTNVALQSETQKQGLGWASNYKESDKQIVFGANNVTFGSYSYVAYESGVILTEYTGVNVVEIPETLSSKPVLGSGITFEGKAIQYVTLPSSISLLGSFRDCTSLVGLKMQEGVSFIAEQAFSGCTSMLYFSLPGSVAEIGDGAFDGCTALTVVYVKSSDVLDAIEPKQVFDPILADTITVSPRLDQANGGLMKYAQIVYVGTETVSSVMDSDLNADDLTMRRYTKVMSASDGYDVYSLLYWHASSSQSFVYLLNDWTPETDYRQISTRYNLFVDGVGRMDEYENKTIVPWHGYSSLIKTITIGRAVSSLGRYSFCDMKNITVVNFNAENCADSEAPKNYFTTESNPGSSGFAVLFGEHVTKVPSYLFYNCKHLNDIVWNTKRVTSIGSYAFFSCVGLTDVVVPDSVLTLGSFAYSGCTKVTSLTIGKGVKNFGTESFSNFGVDENGFYLTSVTYKALDALPAPIDVFTATRTLGIGDIGTIVTVDKNVVSLPENIFYGFNRLVQVVFSSDSLLHTIGSSAFHNCVNLNNVAIPVTTTTIGQYAFDGCTKLANISFADKPKLTFIGEKAFFNTAYYNLDSGALSNWINGVLYINNKKFLLEALPTVNEDYTVLDGTDIIAEKAFASIVGLKYVTIPSSVDVICENAFAGCTGLKTIFLTSPTIISSLISKDAQGGICNYATVIYCRSDLMKNGRTKPGAYISSGYQLVETETMRNNYQYYSYTNLCWELPAAETASTVRAYLLNDFNRPGYYRMEITGEGRMRDFTAIGECPWYNTDSVDYSGLITAITFGRNVSSVGAYAFANFTKTESVVYNNYDVLTSIGKYAFIGCTGLTEILVERNVTSIGEAAFADCVNVTTIRFNARACNDFTALNRIFRSVGRETAGVSIELHNEITRVPAYFADPTDNSATSPYVKIIKFLSGTANRCVSIGDFAFSYCRTATELICDGYALASIGQYAFYDCVALTSISIPTSVRTIGDCAFKDCVGVRQLTLNATDCNVGINVFQNLGGTGDDASVQVYFSESVVSVPERFLYNVASVTEVTFPESDKSHCETIGTLAFGGCVKLQTVILPTTLKEIAQGAFYRCISLKTFSTPFVGGKSGLVAASRYSLFGYVFHADIPEDDKTGMTLVLQQFSVSDPFEFYIPDSIRTVSVTQYINIYYGAFMNCKYIETVNINGGSPVGSILTEDKTSVVTNGYIIGSRAFYNCTALTFVTMTDILREIGDEAFSDCTGLSSITVPEKVTKIGVRAFASCLRVRTLYYNATKCASFTETDNVFYKLGRSLSGVTLYIGDNVATVPSCLFYGSLQQSDTDSPFLVKIGTVSSAAKLQSIETRAFFSCSALSSVSLPSSLTSIGQEAFKGTAFYNQSARRFGALYYEGSGYKYLIDYSDASSNSSATCNVQDGTTVIADYAFTNALITTVIMPASIKHIGVYAFKDCVNLSIVSFNEDMNGSSSLTVIGLGAFYGCGSLSQFVVPRDVKTIEDDAFRGCNNLKTIAIDSYDVCKIITSDITAGYLCANAKTVNVAIGISDEDTGTYIRTRFTKIEETAEYSVYERK